MTDSREAIIRIEELSAASSDLPETDYKKTALASGVTIHDLEQYQEHRNYFRGTFNTNSIEDFIKYVTDEDSSYGKNCFINEKSMQAGTIFNLGTKENPGHADYKAILTLEKTNTYSALLRTNSNTMSQVETIEWLEDWIHVIKAQDNEDKSIDIKKALAAIRRIEIDESKKSEHESQQFIGKRSLMESVSVKGTDESLPAFLTFKCMPYLGFEERTFKLRVTILTARGELSLKLSIVQFEKQQLDIAEEFKKIINDDLKDIDIYLGSFASK